MKKKAILASAMALALMMSPLGGLNASAEEGENASVSEQGENASSSEEGTGASVSGESRAAQSSPRVALSTPYDVQFSENLDRFTFKYPEGGSSGRMYAHICVYRTDDPDWVLDYYTPRDDSCPQWVQIHNRGQGWWTPVELPFYRDLEDSGSYYFKVRMEVWGSGNWFVSEWAISEPVRYDRPETVLGTTSGDWDTESECLFHYPSVEGAAGYEFRLYKWNDESSTWDPCTLVTPRDGLLTGTYHKFAFSNITPDSPRDAGGEDRTRNFYNDIYNNYNNDPAAGRYAVTVRALSGNLNEIANGVEGGYSAILEIGGDSGNDQTEENPGHDQSEDDSSQSHESTPLEEKVAEAAPGTVIETLGVTTLSNAEMKQLLESGVTLEMAYTYEGVDYRIRIPAGAAMDNDIPWYGPLYLAQYYSINNPGRAGMAGGPTYTVQKGDTLGKIARANNMTVAELAAKNPQITNVNVIIQGQTIQIK